MTERIAWVTGGSRGIGAATAKRLAQLGHRVAIGYVSREQEAQSIADAISEAHGPGRAMIVAGDMGDHDAVQQAHNEITKALGPVDILFANHGIYQRTPAHELTPEAWESTLRTNLTGPFLVSRAVLPSMQHKGWGRIVYDGSILGRIGSPHGVDYAASKAGLLGLCRSIAQAYARHGVTANVVAPSMIDTEILAHDTPEKRAQRTADVPVGRIGTPEECAAAVAYLVSEDAGYVTGTELRLDGGFHMG